MPELPNNELLPRPRYGGKPVGPVATPPGGSVRRPATATVTPSARIAWMLAGLLGGVLSAASPLAGGEDWKTGRDFEEALEGDVSVRWAQNPLRNAVRNLSRSQQVAIFLDRRLDPDRLLEFSSQGTLAELLTRLAAQLDAGIGQVGSVIYVGPKPVVAVLPTVAEIRDEEIERTALSRRDSLRRPRPLAWPDLSRPRDLIDRLASEAGIRVEGLEKIPHDLWPEADLPDLAFAQRMSLILAGFDLTFQVGGEGQTLQLVSLPPTASLTRTYRPTAGQNEALRGLVAAAGNAQLTAGAGGISVDGPLEVHRSIQRLIEGQAGRRPPQRKPRGGETRYSLEIKNQPVGPVAKSLAAKLELRIEFDPLAAPQLEQRVSFQVRDATRDELLRALLAPAGLDFRIDGDQLRILPSSPEGS